MYLKSITLKGFKSFPDRTRLEFGSGVSVVVGPNGSGKSNVTDAVLWALGEQSPLAVRGQSMQDVIFAGAPGRQAGGSAEVELLLDDSDGALGLGVPEVSIVRRLDRTGEGEYRLAGARCRLVDVLEVLSDSGLGKEMHSVISQGRVESIVTSKPRDRRLLIEEAAGLGKHRKRRRRAQLKLSRTQDNVDRALDVEREARSRLRPLKRQAEAAELHARLERQSLEARWELARDDLRIALQAREQAQADALEARSRRGDLERELESIADRRKAAEEALARRSAEREELSARSFRARSGAERVAYRIETASAAAEETRRRLERSNELQARLNARPPDEAGTEEAGRRIAELERAITDLDRDLEAELSRELSRLQEQLRSAHAEVAERSAAVDERAAARAEAERRLEVEREQIRQGERELEAARRESARIAGDLSSVDQFLRTQSASPDGTRLLADELQADQGYELALAAALDGRLRAALVPDLTAATALLDRLGSDGGRTLVAPPEGSAGRGGGSAAPTGTSERLEDHLRGSSAAVALARQLLSDAWVVASLDQLPDSFDGLAVTKEGRVFSAPTREVRQAPALGEERILAERNRREQLLRASEAASREQSRRADSLQRATAGAARAEEEAANAAAAHRAAVLDRDETAEQERRIAAQIERRRVASEGSPATERRAQLEARLTAERLALERVQRERVERAAQLQRLEDSLTRDRHLLGALEKLVDALRDASEAIASRLDGFERELNAHREAGDNVAEQLRECAQREAAVHARLHRENEALTEREVRLQRIRDQANDLQQQLDELAGRLELQALPAAESLAAEARHALSSRIERLARRREQLGPVNPLAQQEYTDALEHVEELERQRTDLETALRELEQLIADTDRQIRENFEQTFAAAARNFEQVSAHLFPGGRGRLRLVSDREGPARVLGGASAQEEAPAGEREAEASSEGAPGESDEPLSEEDLLGVEIEIIPAGKAMKRLSLLSGGEKSMTALAFLFAVFLARPCPFYILDEVEAALDDLNIDRFLELLRTYSTQAQFIVVTHQKRTMEAADSLYGISMGSDGISKVISRRLPRAQAA